MTITVTAENLEDLKQQLGLEQKPPVVLMPEAADKLQAIRDHAKLGNWPGGGDDAINEWFAKLRKLVGSTQPLNIGDHVLFPKNGDKVCTFFPATGEWIQRTVVKVDNGSEEPRFQDSLGWWHVARNFNTTWRWTKP